MTRTPLIVAGLALGWACRSAPPDPEVDGPQLTLVETAPVETRLDHPDLPETYDVWRALVQGATDSVELAHFYASDLGSGRLLDVLEDLEDAGARGVRVRFMAGERFYSIYPELIDRLDAHPQIELRRIDLRPVSGGVQHAKYMLIDGDELYLGSANFDSRSLEHIQELGVHVRSTALASALLDVFEYDWALAAGTAPPAVSWTQSGPVRLALDPTQVPDGVSPEITVRAAFAPRDLLPMASTWDLPQILELLDGARERIRIQVMTLDLVGRDGERFVQLEQALQGAAARGVQVDIAVADWGKRAGIVEGLQELTQVPGIEVRFISLPEASTGFVPFARVVHAKFLCVDGQRAWLGTSNWERGYFYASRNVGLVMEGRALGQRLDELFLDVWEGSYAETVDPNREYEAPRRE